MTPAIEALESAGIDFTVRTYDVPFGPDYGARAAAAMGVPPERVFKTIVAQVDGDALVVAIVPVEAQVDLKRLAAAAGGRRAVLADARRAQAATGYTVGGISPLAQKQRLAAFLDLEAAGQATVVVSAGRRGLQVELTPDDLVAATGAEWIDGLSRSAR